MGFQSLRLVFLLKYLVCNPGARCKVCACECSCLEVLDSGPPEEHSVSVGAWIRVLQKSTIHFWPLSHLSERPRSCIYNKFPEAADYWQIALKTHQYSS